MVDGPALPFTRDRVLAAAPTDASPVDDPLDEEGSEGEAKAAVRMRVKAVGSGICLGGSTATSATMAAGTSRSATSSRAFVPAKPRGKPPEAKTAIGGPNLAHLPNVSEELTTGGEVEIRIPSTRASNRGRSAVPRAFSSPSSRATSMPSPAAPSTTPRSLSHTRGRAARRLRREGDRGDGRRGVGLPVRAAPCAPPPDELRTMMREEIAVALERTRATPREETRWASSPASSIARRCWPRRAPCRGAPLRRSQRRPMSTRRPRRKDSSAAPPGANRGSHRRRAARDMRLPAGARRPPQRRAPLHRRLGPTRLGRLLRAPRRAA